MSVPPTSEEITTDSVIDAIALIEMQRQDIKREADPEAWRNRALGQLQEILRQLEEALRVHGPSADRHANVEAVKTAIGRVKSPAGAAGQGQRPNRERTQRRQQPQASRPAQRGRRTMGRRSGR